MMWKEPGDLPLLEQEGWEQQQAGTCSVDADLFVQGTVATWPPGTSHRNSPPVQAQCAAALRPSDRSKGEEEEDLVCCLSVKEGCTCSGCRCSLACSLSWHHSVGRCGG